MKHKGGKITEATKNEIYKWWVNLEYCKEYTLQEYTDLLIKLGVIIRG